MIPYEKWQEWQGSCSLLPYVRRTPLEDGAAPLLWKRAWEAASPYACLLESGKGGRFTLLGIRPVSVIRGYPGGAEVWEPDGSGAWRLKEKWAGRPLDVVRGWSAPWVGPPKPKVQGLPDCIGGLFGYWSYDVARSLEKLPQQAADDLGLPHYLFQRYEELWIVDKRESCLYTAVHVPVRDADGDPRALRRLYEEAGRRAEAMEREWRAWSGIGRDPDAVRQDEAMRRLMEEDALQIDVERVPGLTVSMDKARFGEAVRAVQRYIAQGDVFQVNLSLRQSRSSGLSPEELYEWLRRVNPSPYMGLLRAPDFALVSASPEQLVKLKDGRLSTRPIAGTRRRGRTPEEDLRMERELRMSEKERAEHTMLVDLERNDLGRVSAYGTVQVPEWMTVERYSHVMHLVSQVEGRLAEGKDAFDVLAAVFPGGTITGAPKIRTMEIIEELEPVRRGPYTGSMGWIDYAGDMEFNIIIRTIAAMDGMCHIQAGAGIVIDSDPEREFYECLNKAKALWKAVQYGERLRARES